MPDQVAQNQVKIWRPVGLGGVELLKASYRSQRFARHYHRRYCLGVIEAGAMGFDYLGRKMLAPAGAVNLAVPGEVHNGEPAAPGGWRYRMFYMDPELVLRALPRPPSSVPFIPHGVLQDPALAALVGALHRDLEARRLPALESEARLLKVLGLLLSRYGERPPARPRVGEAPEAVRRARELIHDCCEQDISLGLISRRSGLSRWHLLRVFKKATGLTPHAYLNQVRVQRAKALIAGGAQLSDAALACGFFDQSHLSRRFKALLGVTPGQYRNCVQ